MTQVDLLMRSVILDGITGGTDGVSNPPPGAGFGAPTEPGHHERLPAIHPHPHNPPPPRRVSDSRDARTVRTPRPSPGRGSRHHRAAPVAALTFITARPVVPPDSFEELAP